MDTRESVNRFRQARGQILRRQIETLAQHFGRKIVVLDVGGRADYWRNVGIEGIARIDLVNIEASEFSEGDLAGLPEGLFRNIVGDARNLSDHADKSVDLLHSNSVIEHVGGWGNIQAMAREVQRVGQAGWIQTPAWEFPIEPHFRLPFVHWLPRPVAERLLALSPVAGFRGKDREARRLQVERIHLLTKGDLKVLFPGRSIFVERLLLPKSYCAHWMPDGLTLQTSDRGRRAD